ncbi:ABC transporter permease/substrate-binding protein [Lacticaseibacillus thailandensis]|uniref:Abc-type proline glycine betaine transport system, permease and substrate binding protein n=1 Tax=Lacticaseibacillus thailandensis DSM 22698 = JCM 13996 TaxID=1423810 RepID=A0A0R2C523_9LACO|nr:ABC transporter permease/substrate-binding protein [Lacticaseibacillus thailandensis]KRM86959.1 abc-type proline glycine betaine transport system, permease and substrate binding protein [Lacticaseibacillus thailandensis DSM 22698 = JCM 13996]
MIKEIIHYAQTNAHEILVALGQHIEVSLIATIITIIIAIPLAIVLMNHRKAGEFVLQIASVVQTIPSLAILGLLIPFVGIGTVPAIIALVLYAIMPVFQNTYAGLTNIDPLLIEAADAMGVSRRYKLMRVQIPLAMPMILSGIRIGVVMIIGTATLAALIGGGGLGTYILLGIQSNNNSALFVGAILSAVLAIVASALIKLLSHVSFKRLAIGVVVLAVGIGGAYGVHKVVTPKTTTITIAGKMGGEPEILINMYKQLIEQDNPHVHVVLKRNFGGTSFLFKALRSQQIDIYPEFTGTVMQSLVKTNKAVSHDPQTAYHDAKTALAQQYHLTYLRPMAYQNGYGLTVTQATARQYHLKTIADLAKYPQLRAGFDPDFYQQQDGYPGLKQAYGLHFTNVKTMEPSLRYEALANGNLDVTDAYTTDPQIRKYHLVVLRDSKSFFPPYQGAPVMRSSFAKAHPGIVKSLNRIAGKISTKEMQEMNYQVTVKHRKAAVVAKQYLQAHHLLQ